MGLIEDHNSHVSIPQSKSDSVARSPDQLIDVLSGQLPCWVCRYELSGLSVTGICPECATPVRTTLLAVVDPSAVSFQPLRAPRIAATGLVVWTGAAFLAALCVWLCRITDAIDLWLAVPLGLGFVGVLVPIFAGLSGVGCLVLIRPQRGASRAQTLGPILACALYVPLVLMLWQLHARLDIMAGSPYFTNPIRQGERLQLRCGIGLTMILIALLLRPSVREFAKRSVLMRTGQLTRQTMLALAAAVGVTLAGDLIQAIAMAFDADSGILSRTLSLALISIGSGLVTVGLAGIVWDAIRLLPIIRAGPRSLGDVLPRGSDHA